MPLLKYMLFGVWNYKNYKEASNGWLDTNSAYSCLTWSFKNLALCEAVICGLSFLLRLIKGVEAGQEFWSITSSASVFVCLAYNLVMAAARGFFLKLSPIEGEAHTLKKLVMLKCKATFLLDSIILVPVVATLGQALITADRH